MAYLLPFLGYLADSESVSAYKPDLDTMTITTLEAIASLSCNKLLGQKLLVVVAITSLRCLLAKQ